jgi:hypothetical protein
MYCQDSQTGETRVNKYNNTSKKNNRKKYPTSTKLVDNHKYTLQKLTGLQNELFQDKLTLDEYKEYLNQKSKDNMYYYRDLTNDGVTLLEKRYEKLIQKENNHYQKIINEKKFRKKQRKLFIEKKERLINEKKRELIFQLLKETRSSNSRGVLHNNDHLSTNPDDWKNTKEYLFIGGRYLESSDKEWVITYNKLVNGDNFLFDCSSMKDMYRYIYKN